MPSSTCSVGFHPPCAPLAAARIIAIMGKSRKNKSKEIFPDDPEEFAGAPSLERRAEPAVGTSTVARKAFRFPPTRISHRPYAAPSRRLPLTVHSLAHPPVLPARRDRTSGRVYPRGGDGERG